MTAYGPGDGPAPAVLTDDALSELIGASTFAALATTKKAGRRGGGQGVR
ncbi:hypothetical protein FHU30_002573 [Actinomadura rupiterrae]|nr:hypothetical protein [Actinomadura rupiterrae]